MAGRKRTSPRAVNLPRLGPLSWAFAAGVAVVLLLLGLSDRILWGDALRGGPGPGGETDPQWCVAELAQRLEPAARWESAEPTCPLHWKGRLPEDESLVQWNAWATRTLEDLGLQVYAGTEEIIERRGRWPLRRLTLIAGLAGETVATIEVESARSPDLPPAF